MKLKNVIWLTTISLVVFIGLFVIADRIWGNQLRQFGEQMVSRFGGTAVFLTFFVAAVAVFPLPDHAMSVFAWLGGMCAFENVLYATSGSLCGATAAYVLGRKLGYARFISAFLGRNKDRATELIRRHGTWGLVIACLTPFPYSPVCWICGILKYDPKKYVPIVLFCRLIKVVYVLLLVQAGILTF